MPKNYKNLSIRYYVDLIGYLVVSLVLIILGICGSPQPYCSNTLTLFLSLVIGFISVYRPWLNRPHIRITEDIPRKSFSDNQQDSWFIRLKIENFGFDKAIDCKVKLIGVYAIHDDSLLQLEKFDPLWLYWTKQNHEKIGFEPLTIYGKGDYSFADVLHIKKSPDFGDGEQHHNLSVVLSDPMTLPKKDWKNRENRFSPLSKPGLLEGEYYLRIGIYGDNINFTPKWFYLNCKPTSVNDHNFRSNVPAIFKRSEFDPREKYQKITDNDLV